MAPSKKEEKLSSHPWRSSTRPGRNLAGRAFLPRADDASKSPLFVTWTQEKRACLPCVCGHRSGQACYKTWADRSWLFFFAPAGKYYYQRKTNKLVHLLCDVLFWSPYPLGARAFSSRHACCRSANQQHAPGEACSCFSALRPGPGGYSGGKSLQQYMSGLKAPVYGTGAEGGGPLQSVTEQSGTSNHADFAFVLS